MSHLTARALLCSASLIFVAGLAACGPDDLRDVEDGPDAGAPDAGGRPDAGSPADAGSTPDAGPGRDLVVTSAVATDPRRGPIVLTFGLDDPDGDVGTGHLVELQGTDGTWGAAHVTTLVEDGEVASYLWDSFTDVATDTRAHLRLVVNDPDGDVTLPFDVEVRNQPDTDRTVIVSHDLAENAGGGAGQTGNEVSIFLWNGLATDSGFKVGDLVRLSVGTGPTRVRAAPHGRATAVLEEMDGTISILTTPLAADPDAVVRSAVLTLPVGTPSDLRWSHDGRFLFVLGSRGETATATLWRYAPTEDLSRFGLPTAVTALPGPPMRLDVSATGEFIVMCGSGGTGKDHVVTYDAKGQELARVDDEYGPPNTLAYTPAGNFAVMTSDLFGDDLRVFAAGGTRLSQVGSTVSSIAAPDEIVFHPASTATRAIGLVSNVQRNRVTPVTISAAGVQPGTAATGVPLATDMDIIERGPQTGTVLVATVSASSDDSMLTRVTLTATGTATAHGAAIVLGTTTRDIPSGVAIQR